MLEYNAEEMKKALSNFSAKKVSESPSSLSYNSEQVAAAVRNYGAKSAPVRMGETSRYNVDEVGSAVGNYLSTKGETIIKELEAAQEWQSQDKMRDIIAKVEQSKRLGAFDVDYDGIISALKAQMDVYSGYSSKEEYDKEQAEIKELSELNTVTEEAVVRQLEAELEMWRQYNGEVKKHMQNPKGTAPQKPNTTYTYGETSQILEEKKSRLEKAKQLQFEKKTMEYEDFSAKSQMKDWSEYYLGDDAETLRPSEKAIYNYYRQLGSEGDEAANRAAHYYYLNTLKERVNYRKAEEKFSAGYEGNTFKEVLQGFSGGFHSGVKGIGTGLLAFSQLTRGESKLGIPNAHEDVVKRYAAPDSTQMLSSMIADDLNKKGWIASAAYGVTTGIGQMAPTIITSKLLGGGLAATSLVSGKTAATVGKVAGRTLLGASSYGNGYAEMINEGYTNRQAQTYGLLTAASEVFIESMFGGYDALRGTPKGNLLMSVASKLDDGFLKTALTIANKFPKIFSVSEMSEEMFQELLDPVFKTIATGIDDPRLKDVDWGQVLYAGVIGGFTASILNGTDSLTGSLTNISSTIKEGRSLKKSGINIEGLREIGQKMPADTVANKLANKVTEKSGAYKIARLFNEVGAELTRQNQADIADNLTRKGVLASDAETIATYLSAAVDGAEFTSEQIEAIENNPLIAEAMRETLIDPSSSVNQRTTEAKRAMWGDSSDAVTEASSENGEAEVAAESEASPLTEEERQRRIQEIESGDFSGIRKFAGMTGNAQQSADGAVETVQRPNAQQMVIPTVTEDPSWTKSQRREHIEADVRESARQFGVGDDVADSIAFIAGTTGTHVLFVDRVVLPDGKAANGYFDRSQNLILISKDAESPVYEVVKHELVHSISGTPLYENLVDFVKKSPQIKRLLDNSGVRFETLVEAKMAEYAAHGNPLDYNGAVEEIVADYTAQYLLTDQQSIAELFKAQQNVFYKFLYNIRTWLKNIRTPKDQHLLQQAEQLYVKALSQKGKRYYKSKYDAEQFDVSDGKYAIKTLPDGKRRYVQAEHQVIRGEDPALWEDQIISYVNDVIIKNGKEIKIITEEGDTLTINGRTAWKLGERNKRRGGKRIGDDFYRAKGNAAGHIDELAETSSLTGKKPYKEHGRKGEPFGVDGFDYRTAFFRDLDGSYYRMRLSIGKDGNLKTVYNIGEIKKVPFPVNGSKAQAGTAPLDNTVPQSGAVVNTQYTQEGGEYSIGTGEDFETKMLRLVEQYGAQPKGFAPERDVSIPKSITGTDRVSLTARTIAESKSALPDSMIEEFNRNLLNEAFSYRPKTNKSELSFANEKLAELGFEGALDYWRSKQQDDASAGGNVKALGAVLLHEAAKRGDTRTVMELSVGISMDNTNAGQALQASRLIKAATPEGRVYALQKFVDRENAKNSKKRRKAEVTEEADAIRRLIRDAQKRGAPASVIEAFQRELNELDGSLYLPESAVKNILSQKTIDGVEQAFTDALIEMANQKPATWVEKWNQWRYLAMLGNVKTHARNFFSNTVFAPVVQTKNVVKFVLESILQSKLSERTTSLGNHFVVEEKYRDFVRKDWEKNKSTVQSGGKHNPSHVLDEYRNVYTSKAFAWMEWLRKKNSDLLEAEDALALGFHYKRALAQYLSANKIDVDNIDPKTLGRARDIATKEAKKATFRDESVVANWLYETSKKNAAFNLIVEGIVPFKKTPVNVLRRGLEYSPVGFVEAYLDFNKMRKGDTDITLNDVLDKVASGLTGTAILALGAFLAHLGIVRLRKPEKEKEEKWRDLLGEQNYSIVFGDHSYTIDWLAPSVLPLFVGAELVNIFSETASFGEVLEAMTRVSDPVFELSMMQGIQDTVKSASYGGGLLSMAGSTATSYLSQALPTLGGQIARTVDDTRRQNYVEDGSPFASLQYSAQQALGKIPGLASTRKEYVNQFGETESTGFVERAFENLISPGYYAKNRDGRVEDEITRLYESTKEASVLPSASIKKFTEDKKEYILSAQESTDYQKKKGTMSYNLLKKVIPSNAYESMDDAQRAYAVGKVYEYATEKAEQVIMKKRGDEYEASSSAKKIDTVISDDKDIADYLLFAYWEGHTSGDKDYKGNTISGSKKKKIRQYAKDAGYTAQEIKYFMKLLGYSS